MVDRLRARQVLVLVAAMIALASARAVAGEDERLVSGSVGERIAKWLEGAEAAGFTGAVLAAKNGEVVVAVGVGSADLNGEQPITPATLFEIASASKQFTAAAVLALAERKKLRLDDPISKHLAGVPSNCSAITVRHLLQHTSGIPGTNSRGGGDNLAAVLPVFLAGGPRHTPGTHWEYWNQGYSLLTAIIARAAKTSYVDYCKKRIFKPGLKDYALGWFVRTERGRLVHSHGGSVRGFLADIRRYPGEDACVFVLSNRDDAPLQRIADGIEKILFGGTAVPLRAKLLPVEAGLAEALVGQYKSKRGRKLVIERAGGTLRFSLHWSPPAGPVTRGTVGADANRALCFDHGEGVDEIEMSRNPAKPVQTLTWSGMIFRRD